MFMILVVARSEYLIHGPASGHGAGSQEACSGDLDQPPGNRRQKHQRTQEAFSKACLDAIGKLQQAAGQVPGPDGLGSLLLLPEVPMGELVRACWLKIDNLPDQLWFP